MADDQLDITGENCPMTFVRAKLRLERLGAGQILRIRLRDGESLQNVPRAMADHGHEILNLQELEAGIFELTVRKQG